MWELSGKACAKCSETRYHLAARPPEGEECCVAACGRVRVCTCAVCVCVFVYVGKATVALVVKKSSDIERYSVSMGVWSIRARAHVHILLH